VRGGGILDFLFPTKLYVDHINNERTGVASGPKEGRKICREGKGRRSSEKRKGREEGEYILGDILIL